MVMVMAFFAVPSFATEETLPREELINKTGPEPAVYLASGNTAETYTYEYPTGAELNIIRESGTNTVQVDGYISGTLILRSTPQSASGWASGVNYMASVGDKDVRNAIIDFSTTAWAVHTNDFKMIFRVGGQNGLYDCLNLTNAAYFMNGGTPASVSATIDNSDGTSTVNVTLTYYTSADKSTTQTVTETKTYNDTITSAGIYAQGYNKKIAYVYDIVLGVTPKVVSDGEEEIPGDDTEDEGDYIYAPEEILVDNSLPVADKSINQWLITANATPDTYSFTYPSGAKFDITRKTSAGPRGVLFDSGVMYYMYKDWDGLGTISTMSAGDGVDVSNSKLTFDFEIDHTTRGNADYRTRVVAGNSPDAANVVMSIKNSALYYAYGPAKVSVVADNRGGKSNVSATITYYTNAEKTETAQASANASYNFTVTHLGFVAEHYGRGFELYNTSFKKQDSYLKYTALADKFPTGGGADGVAITEEETIYGADNKAFITVGAFNNTGTQNATWKKYEGEKLYLLTPNYDYKGDVHVAFGWAKGTEGIKYVEFTLSNINRADNLSIFATRQNANREILGNLAGIWSKGNDTGLIVDSSPSGKSYVVRIESDPRTGKVYYYVNGIFVRETGGELIGDEELINLGISTPGGQIVQIENISVGTAELTGGEISDITLSEDGKSATVKTLNPVYHGMGYYGNELSLFIAGYESENRLADVSTVLGVPARGRRTLTAVLEEDIEYASTKAMLWNLTEKTPLKDFKVWEKISD